MNLYLIRHTKVDVEPGICYGQTDVGVRRKKNEDSFIYNINLVILDWIQEFTDSRK